LVGVLVTVGVLVFVGTGVFVGVLVVVGAGVLVLVTVGVLVLVTVGVGDGTQKSKVEFASQAWSRGAKKIGIGKSETLLTIVVLDNA
jgi:hypothetical protein